MSEEEHAAIGGGNSTSTNVTEEEKKLADLCMQDFNKGNYKNCLANLDKLLKIRPKDPKVLHNKSVAEFYRAEQKTGEEFKKSLQNICSQVNLSLENAESLDDVDHCIYYYNQAVILYHSRQYHAAIALLDKVFQFIEPLEESLGRKVCLLLVELYLRTFQPDKALGMVGYTENAMLFSTNIKPEDVGEFKTKLQQLKARGYVMLRSAKGCKREIKGLVASAGLSAAAIFLKGNVEYTRNNPRKAMKMLGGASKSGDNVAAMYYNNLGCIHFYMRKPQLGKFYLQKALEENEKSRTGADGPLHAAGAANHYYEIMYNLGIQWLHANKPQQAFDCMIEVLQVYPANPRLWLRVAECCVLTHSGPPSQDEKGKTLSNHIGTGYHRKLILASSVSKPYQQSVDGQSSAMPMATFEFAYLCLKNALLLLQDGTAAAATNDNNNPSGDEGVQATQGSESGNVLIPTPPGNPIHGSEIVNLCNSVLVASAYVALCLEEFVMALRHAELLLAQPQVSTVHRLLGHLYAGEAQAMLNRLPEALDHFNTEKSKDSNENSDTRVEDARSALRYNATVAHALQTDFDKAGDDLRQMKNLNGELAAHATMLATYIQAHTGHADLTRAIVKQQYR